MKKSLIVPMLFLAAVTLTAQNNQNDQNQWENNRRMAVTFDPNAVLLGTIAEGFGASAGFEYAFSPQFSLKTKFCVLVFDPSAALIYADAKKSDPLLVSYQFALEGRYYPMEHYVEGFFINGGLQYQGISGRACWEDYDSYVCIEDPDDGSVSYESVYTEFRGDNTLGIFTGLGYKFVLGKKRPGIVIEPTVDYAWSFHFGPSKADLGFPTAWLLGMQGIRITANFGIAF